MNHALALFGALVLASTTTRSSRGCSSRARPSGPGAARNSTRRKLDFGRCECNINSLTLSGTKNRSAQLLPLDPNQKTPDSFSFISPQRPR
jgi:hypothetical protein